MRIDLVTQSMGGLIARQWVEGPEYCGGVDRLIMIAPPNDGSVWSRFSLLMKLAVNASDWWNDPQWNPAWMFTQGITQAGRDLEPGSRFLTELNSHPRRSEIRYTIIAGDQPLAFRIAAQTTAFGDRLLDDVLPDSGIWRHIDSAIDGQIQRLEERTGQSDGPVSLDSARLAGVDDFVIVPADHIALYKCVQGRAPASWPIIQERLDEHRHGG
jgi:pimeloyl-ACP methyl ester carboxylesterase